MFYAKAQSTQLFILLDLYILFAVFLLKVRNTDPELLLQHGRPVGSTVDGGKCHELGPCLQYILLCFTTSILTHFQLLWAPHCL